LAIATPTMAERTWYSVEEAAKLINRAPFTIRRYCRDGELNASKRRKRGPGASWWISATEIARFRNDGPLPPNPSRNNVA
jgi:transposase